MDGSSSNASASCCACVCVELLADVDPEELAFGRLRFERIVERERLIVPVGIELPDADALLRRCLGGRFLGGRHDGERYTAVDRLPNCSHRRTENSCQVPGTPLSTCCRDRRTRARAHHKVLHGARDPHLPRTRERRTLAPMWTATPPMSSPRTSLSPVWTPARSASPRPGPRSMSMAQRTARAGPSNVAKNPSPTTLTSRGLRSGRARAGARPGCGRPGGRASVKVAELGRPLRRADDIGEQDGCQERASRFGGRPDAGDERLRSRRPSRRGLPPRSGCRCRAARRNPGRRGCARRGSGRARRELDGIAAVDDQGRTRMAGSAARTSLS